MKLLKKLKCPSGFVLKLTTASCVSSCLTWITLQLQPAFVHLPLCAQQTIIYDVFQSMSERGVIITLNDNPVSIHETTVELKINTIDRIGRLQSTSSRNDGSHTQHSPPATSCSQNYKTDNIRTLFLTMNGVHKY